MTVNRSDLSRKFVEKGAKAYHYVVGTTTPLTVYQDAGGSTPHAFPIAADANGRMPSVYVPYGNYRERVVKASGVVLWDDDQVPNPAPVTIEGGSTDPELLKETGDIIARFQSGAKAGYVRLNGRTIGNASSGATERANSDCEDLFIHLWGAMANAEAPVSGGRGASAADDWAANKTITLPSTRLRSLSGVSGMGNVDVVPSAGALVPSGKGDTRGAVIGADVHTITTAEMPFHSHGGVTGSQIYTNTIPTFASVTVSSAVPQYNVTVATGSSDLTVAQSAHSVAAEGSSAAHNNLSPSLLVTFYIKL